MVTLKLCDKILIIEVSIVCQWNSFNNRTSFSPRQQIRVMLKYRYKHDGQLCEQFRIFNF